MDKKHTVEHYMTKKITEWTPITSNNMFNS